jgi:hypothetical protein
MEILDITNGLPLTRTRLYAGPFVERPDGRRIVALGGNGDGPEALFDMLADVTPVPLWIADLAEAVGGWRLGDHNTVRPLTPEEQRASIETARKELVVLKGSADRWAEFAGWYLSDEPDPAISPYSPMLRSQLAKKEADDWARAHAPTSSALPDAAPKGEQEGASNPQPRTFARPGTVVAEQTATTPGPAATSSIDAEGGAASPPDAPAQPEQAPVVIPPQGGSSKFYRARFTGFDEKQARETCRAMKLQGRVRPQAHGTRPNRAARSSATI